MAALESKENVILIGMPGVGKSTAGVLLAKVLSRQFLDTDVLIQAREGRRLQDIIDQDGLDAFRAIEERHILQLEVRGHIIATGGSVVYSDAGMAHLKRGGLVVYLHLALDVLEHRVTNLDTRGVVRAPQQSYAELYEERLPLYERYADLRVDCAGMNHEEVVAAVAAAMEGGRLRDG
jgi:shikimate kinase